MSLFKICKGAETNLPQTLTNGYCYFCTDTTNFYIDYTDTYGALTRSKISAKYADKLRYTEDGNFVEIEPTDVLTKNNYETAIGVAATDKNGLMSSGDKTKLDGIADGAEVNVQPDWNQNDETADDYIKNRTHWVEYGLDVAGFTITLPISADETTHDEIPFEVGQVWNVVSNKNISYSLTVEKADDGTVYIGVYPSPYYNSTAPFYVSTTKIMGDNMWIARDGNTSITLTCVSNADIYHTIPFGYFPDTIFSRENAPVKFGVDDSGEIIKTATVQGITTIASAIGAHAEGWGSKATGNYSHAEGSSKATNEYSHSEGVLSTASGYVSHAEGQSTASGQYSHAEGTSTASGGYSHTEGIGTIASSRYQHVQGTYNVEDSSNVYAHIVGNGENTTAKSNAHALDWNGNAYFAGNVYVNGTNADATGGQEVATKQYVDDLAPTEATTTENGLMSALDKIKLDGIAENADDNVQSDWSQDTDTDDSYIKNRPFKTLSGDDFSVVDNTLSLSTAKLDSIKTLGITGAQADQFIKVSSVDSNGNPTAYSVESLDDKYISSKGGTYDLDTTLVLNKSNNTSEYDEILSFKGYLVPIDSTKSLSIKTSIINNGIFLNRNSVNPDGSERDDDEAVATFFVPNIWQLLDDRIAGDHKKLYITADSINTKRYDSGWKNFFIKSEKDRTLIYNDQKLIDFNESRLTNLGTPTNDTDAATKKYVDDLVPVEATTSVSGLMSATDKVKLDGVASNAASVTIKTWTTADIV